MSSRSAISTAHKIDAAQADRAQRQGLQRPSQAARDERSGRRADRHAGPLACRHRHRRAECRQRRVRREAADAEDRRRARRSSRPRASTIASARWACSSAPASTIWRPSSEYIDTGKLGKITLARTWWHGNTYHLRKAPASSADAALQSGLGALPGTAEVARLGSAAVFQLARLSRFRRRPGHRSVHPLDRRGPHVHGRRIFRLPRQASGGVYNYKDGRTAPDTINVLLEYPQQFTATFEATLVPGITGAASNSAARRAGLDRPRPLRVHARRAAARRPTTVKASSEPRPGPRSEFPGLREVAEAAQWRCADRPSLGAGFAPGQYLLHAEAAHRFRPGPRRNPAVLTSVAGLARPAIMKFL